MFKNKILRVSLLALFILASFTRSLGSVPAALIPVNDERSMIGNMNFLDSKGTVEPVIQLTNGGSFQQHIQKFKKYPGTATHFFSQTSLHFGFIHSTGIHITEHPSVPIYLFNKSFLI